MARNKYPEITERRILEAATKLFMQNGWENTTVQDIIDELGDLTRGAFYHHFKSKEDIIDAVLNKMSNENNPFKETKEMSGLNGLEKLKNAFMLSISKGEQLDAVKAIPSILINPKIVCNQLKTCVTIVAPNIREFIEEGNEDGSLSVPYPKQAAESFALLTNIWLSPIIFSVDTEEYVQKLLHLKDLYNSIGLPVIDDQIITVLKDLHHNI